MTKEWRWLLIEIVPWVKYKSGRTQDMLTFINKQIDSTKTVFEAVMSIDPALATCKVEEEIVIIGNITPWDLAI